MQVVSPTASYFVLNEALGGQTITLSGTSNAVAGEKLDINCYAAKKRYLLAAEVEAQAGGAFSFTGPFTSIAGRTCVLRAVPHNDTTDYPPGSASPFQGPTLGIGRSQALAIESGPNAGALLWYYIYASQLAGGFDYRSLGDCSILDSYAYDLVTFAPSRLDDCDATLWWENGANGFPGVAAPTRSEIQVDGANAYLPGNASELFAGAQNNPGFPALRYRYEVEPASGDLTIEETDQIVKCAPEPSTYPPTPSSCSSFVPTGVEAFMGITQGANGRVASVTQWFSSTDGAAHTVDLLEHNQFAHINEDGELDFPWTGEGFLGYGTAGQQLPAAPSGAPGSLFIKGSGSTPEGSEESPQGSLTFSNPPEGEEIVSSTLNPESWVDLHYHRTIAPGGSFALGFTYASGFLLGEVQQFAAAAQAAYLPSVAITGPANGSGTATASVDVTGTASDQTGLSSLVVNGHPVSVGANGSWTTNVALSPGANTITATATNVFGYSAQSAISVTYVPTVLTFQGHASASGRRGPRGALFTVSCQALAGTSCEGYATLTTTKHLQGTRAIAISARTRKRRKQLRVRRVAVGVAKQFTFSIPAGQTQTLLVPLNANGLKLLARFHALPVTLTVTFANGPSGPTVLAREALLIRPAAKPPKRLQRSRRRARAHSRAKRR